MFVSYPRWRGDPAASVTEIQSGGSKRPYPSDSWNSWANGDPDLQQKFVCVQSVYVDDENFLWVLDSGNPYLQGVLPGAPKLLKINLADNTVARSYSFTGCTFAPARYLNDVRIDTKNSVAYVSESGMGALVVLDLETAAARFVLDGHTSTRADDVTVTIEGRTVGNRIHCDGIALTRDGGELYFRALSAWALYRIATQYLRDTALTAAELQEQVESMGEVGVCDGMEFGNDGSLYVTAIEENAIKRLTPGASPVTIVRDDRVKWPDSIAITDDNVLYFTTSQIHLGAGATMPYYVFRLQL
jgi:sugar lactone lactonase YvrE